MFDLNEVLTSEELRKKYYQWTFYKEEWFNENDMEQKYIVTFSLKYMDYQRRIRDKQIARAEKALASPEKSERTRQTGYKRFITRIPVTNNGEVAGKTVYGLNEYKIRDEERYDGFYDVATNLDDPAEEIIKIRGLPHISPFVSPLWCYSAAWKKLGHKYTCEQIVSGLRKMRFIKINPGLHTY